MLRFLTQERLLGIFITILAVLLGHAIRTTTGAFYSAPFYIILAVVANISGLRVAAFAAAMFTVGAYLQWMPEEPTRFYVNTFCFFALAYIVGHLLRQYHTAAKVATINQEKADAYDTLNGNINRVNHYNKRLRDLINGWQVLNEGGKLAIVEEVQGGLANLAQALVGWHAIAEEQDKVTTKRLG